MALLAVWFSVCLNSAGGLEGRRGLSWEAAAAPQPAAYIPIPCLEWFWALWDGFGTGKANPDSHLLLSSASRFIKLIYFVANQLEHLVKAIKQHKWLALFSRGQRPGVSTQEWTGQQAACSISGGRGRAHLNHCWIRQCQHQTQGRGAEGPNPD